MALPLARRAIATFNIQCRTLHRSASLAYIKDYDAKKKLKPVDIEYKPDDSRFLRGPTPRDVPYIAPTEEEIAELGRVIKENEIQAKMISEVDPEVAPYNQVFQGQEDYGRFTQTEVIPDNESRWFWVDRLMPKNILDQPIREGSLLIPPMPKVPPNLPYFVARTRSRLFPLYRTYKVFGRNGKFWRNRWDGRFNKYHVDEVLDNLDTIKWENNEKTCVLTEVNKISGDIWKLEEDIRQMLEKLHPDSDLILSAVNEVRGQLEFKGDYIKEIHNFLRDSGF